jgi:phage baseplate assembly protein V
MIDQVDRRIARALGGLRHAFRAVITLVRTGAGVQLAQADGVAGEQLQDAEVFQHYGITSNPPAGSMAVVLPLGGKTSHGIVIATEHAQYRLVGLESGEVALYSDEGDSVWLKRGRVIEVTTQTLRINAETAVEITTPTLTVTGQIIGQGGLAISGGEGAAAQIEGSLEVTGGDIVADGYGLKTHKNPGGGPAVP